MDHEQDVKQEEKDTTPRGQWTNVINIFFRIVIYPWFIWSAVAFLPRLLWRKARRRLTRVFVVILHVFLYLIIGLPVTLYLTAELLITMNEAVVGEQANYRLQSDYKAGFDKYQIILPGPHVPNLPPVLEGQNEDYRQYLVQLYSPVFVQRIAHNPQWDIPLDIAFDGNDDPRDNIDNEKKFRPHKASVLGELTAETLDSYYFLYSLYHVKDYDHPVREFISNWTYHDNDNEGLMIRVDKRTRRIAQMETWFHNRFLLYDITAESTGTEPVQGMIHVEDETHPIIYSQSQGHGVRAFQALDIASIQQNSKILRFRAGRDHVPVKADRSVQSDATYDIANFDNWYAQATGPFGTEVKGKAMFEAEIPLGRRPNGDPIVIGRFITGREYTKSAWARPKPPWSWDGIWDKVPIWIWHFLPHYAFSSHSGKQLSNKYIYNRPFEKTFKDSPDQLLPLLDLKITGMSLKNV